MITLVPGCGLTRCDAHVLPDDLNQIFASKAFELRKVENQNQIVPSSGIE